MATRLHRIGTIFSRVDGAYRKGLLKEKNLPVWYNVYKRFPPKYEPIYTASEPEVQIRPIFYEEDTLRSEIHKICSKKQEVINLFDGQTETESQKLLKTCQQYIAEGMTREDALNKIKASVVDVKKNQKDYKKIMQDVKEILPAGQTTT